MKLLREDKSQKPDFTYVGEMYGAFSKVMFRLTEGEKKYARMNFENCTDPLTYKQSFIRHALQYINGQADEEHLTAAIVNGLILLHLENTTDKSAPK